MFEKFIHMARPGSTWTHEMASIQIFQRIYEEHMGVFQKYGLDEQDITFVKVGQVYFFNTNYYTNHYTNRRSSSAPWMVPQCALTSPGHTRGGALPRPSSMKSSQTRVAPLMSTRFAFKNQVTSKNLLKNPLLVPV